MLERRKLRNDAEQFCEQARKHLRKGEDRVSELALLAETWTKLSQRPPG